LFGKGYMKKPRAQRGKNARRGKDGGEKFLVVRKKKRLNPTTSGKPRREEGSKSAYERKTKV